MTSSLFRYVQHHNQVRLTIVKICARFRKKCFINKKVTVGGEGKFFPPSFPDWESSKKPKLDRINRGFYSSLHSYQFSHRRFFIHAWKTGLFPHIYCKLHFFIRPLATLCLLPYILYSTVSCFDPTYRTPAALYLLPYILYSFMFWSYILAICSISCYFSLFKQDSIMTLADSSVNWCVFGSRVLYTSVFGSVSRMCRSETQISYRMIRTKLANLFKRSKNIFTKENFQFKFHL